MLINTYFMRPVSVQAVRITEANRRDVANWMNASEATGVAAIMERYNTLLVTDRQGRGHLASPGCYVVKTAAGFEVLEAEAFNSVYSSDRPTSVVGPASVSL